MPKDSLDDLPLLYEHDGDAPQPSVLEAGRRVQRRGVSDRLLLYISALFNFILLAYAIILSIRQNSLVPWKGARPPYCEYQLGIILLILIIVKYSPRTTHRHP